MPAIRSSAVSGVTDASSTTVASRAFWSGGTHGSGTSMTVNFPLSLPSWKLSPAGSGSMKAVFQTGLPCMVAVAMLLIHLPWLRTT